MVGADAPSIGLIGCGRWGRLVLRDLVASGAQVHVVCRDAQSVAAAKSGGALGVSETVELLPEVDGYVVVTPSASHAEVIRELLPSGKPVFVEKPMTTDAKSARELADAGEGQLFVMEKWRYHRGIEEMRRQIEQGRIGRLRMLRMQRWSKGHNYTDCGPVWILSPHDISIADHLLGEVPPLIAAEPLLPDDPQWGFTARLGRPGDVQVTLDCSVFSADHVRRLIAVGDEGILELRGGYERCLYHKPGNPRHAGSDAVEIPFAEEMPLLAEIEGFIEFLSGGPPPLCGAQKGYQTVERLAEIEAALATA